jgi:hypothetical protein
MFKIIIYSFKKSPAKPVNCTSGLSQVIKFVLGMDFSLHNYLEKFTGRLLFSDVLHVSCAPTVRILGIWGVEIWVASSVDGQDGSNDNETDSLYMFSQMC